MTSVDEQRSTNPRGETRAHKEGGVRRTLSSPWLPSLVSAIALIVWIVSLPLVDTNRIGGWGLLTALPTSWYGAFGIALGAVVFALISESTSTLGPLNFKLVRRRRLVPSMAVLLVILFATTSLVYEAPRYPWTYKHIGVTEYLLTHKVPATNLDIYQNFPGFFYLMGFVHEITRIPLQTMAQFAEVTSTAINAVALYWAIGALTRNSRIRAFTVVIFTLTNWIGQSYFAPQSFAFAVSFFVVGAYLRLVAFGMGDPRQDAIWRQLQRGSSVGERALIHPFWSGPIALVACGVAFTAIVVSHQFTPAAVLAQLLVLTVLFRLKHPWLVLIFVALEGLWTLHTYSYVSSHFSLLERASYDNIRPPPAFPPVQPGANVMVQVPHIITILVVVATLGGILRTYLRERSVVTLVIPAALVLAPMAIVAVQPYGQEGILRAYLFALPWCSVVIARDLLRVDRPAAPLKARLLMGLAVALLGVLAVPAVLGNEAINHVHRADVTADAWFERNAPAGTELLVLVPAYPSRSTESYDRHILLDDPLTPNSLRDADGFKEATSTAQDLLALTKDFAKAESAQHDIYLALGPTQQAYLTLYGLMSESEYAKYIDLLSKDEQFAQVYAADGSYLFQVR